MENKIEVAGQNLHSDKFGGLKISTLICEWFNLEQKVKDLEKKSTGRTFTAKKGKEKEYIQAKLNAVCFMRTKLYLKKEEI